MLASCGSPCVRALACVHACAECWLLVVLYVLCCWCRVTPDGAQPMTGSNPTAAWQEVYKNAPPIEGMSAKDSAIAVAARAASVCGPRLFGLQHRVVAALIESLPDAALCEGYIAWKGTPPATLPTVRHVVQMSETPVRCLVTIWLVLSMSLLTALLLVLQGCRDDIAQALAGDAAWATVIAIPDASAVPHAVIACLCHTCIAAASRGVASQAHDLRAAEQAAARRGAPACPAPWSVAV